jgi:quinol-cytochrome oxidoreductase complex cytochrome b subunit
MTGKARGARNILAETRLAVREWLRSRIRIAGVLHFLGHKTVPLHRHTTWYYWGNILLTLFMIQACTGVALLFYYQPTPATAYESVRRIALDTQNGWWIRSLHAWSANLMVGAAFVHLFSVYFLKSYRRPRELTYLSGMGMFFVLLGFGFSGYLLPWNELSFFATKVGTGIAETTPFIGHALKVFLRGGEEVGAASLTRFFAIHVAVLPSALMALLSLHFFLIQVHGMSVPPSLSDSPTRSRFFFPDFVLREAAIACLLIAIVVSLAAFFPWEIGQKADPMHPTPPDIRPEWYFLFMYKALQWLPATIGPWNGGTVGVMFFAALFAALAAVPFLDRGQSRQASADGWRIAGIAFLVFVLITTALAMRKSVDQAPETTQALSRPVSGATAAQASTNTAAAPAVSADEQQRRRSRASRTNVTVILVLALSTAYFLWSKARDIERLREQGFFEA